MEGCGIRLRIHPSFIIYLVILYLVDGINLVICLLISLTLHETAHLIAGFMLSEAFEQIDVTPFGGIITYQSGCSSSKGWKGIVVAASGPAANYAAILVLASIHADFLLELQKTLIRVNASMLLLNLLPVLPLDGGRIVFSAGYYLFPVTALLTVLACLSGVTGLIFVILALYGYIYVGKLNISLLLVGAYVLVSIRREQTALLLNNLYTVLHERIRCEKSSVAAKIYYANENELLISLLPCLGKREYILCLTRINEKRFLIDEDEICRVLMEHPNATVNDAIRQHKDA